ncbi:uncharacterized protein LOC135335805 [Halichondria panicea]|uniref:uncharacterized protein LOC135335805 n=1 Tax=Halichondria panicea TaxID=6063 RepID=UPI00312B838E
MLLAGDVESNHGPRMGSSAQSVSLQGLLDKYQLTTSQVNREIQQIDIPYLALHFDNVKLYVDAMELTPGQQNDVQKSADTHEAMIKCLKIWKGNNPAQATFRTLLEMLVKLMKGEIAGQVCQYLKEGVLRKHSPLPSGCKTH